MKSMFFCFLLLFGGVWSWGQCPTGNLTFSEQSQIDNFIISYPSCTVILGNVLIDGQTTSSITNLNGLSGITSIGGNLQISNNFSLLSIAPLENLTSVGGRVTIASNQNLITLHGLDSLVSIGGTLHIDSNIDLLNINALHLLTSIPGSLYVDSNFALKNLNGLNSVSSISGDLSIIENDKLESLAGFDSLNHVGGDMDILGNYVLSSLEGFESLNNIDGKIRILGNDSLSLCAIYAICSKLINSPDSISIGNVFEGCLNNQNVQNACTNIGSYSPKTSSLPLSIAPNPTSDNITLRYSLTETSDSELLITNAQGMVVQSQRLGKQGLGDYALPVDLVGLPAGLYLVTVRAGEQVGVGKVVRM